MAIFIAGSQWKDINIDFSEMEDNAVRYSYGATFSAPPSYVDPLYAAWFDLQWSLRGLERSSFIGGEDLTISAQRPLGTMTGYYEYDENSDLIWLLKDISADAADFVGRWKTSDTEDDRDWLEAVLVGNDNFFMSTDDDKISGYAGNDEIWGYAGNDFLLGGSGNDYLVGGLGDDFVSGGSGNDRFAIEIGNDMIIGGSGRDTAVHTGGAIVIDLNLITGQNIGTGFGTDIFIGIEDIDSSNGTGSDIFKGTSAANLFKGGDGIDRLIGRGGNDRLFGGDDKDFVSGGSGKDVLNGGDGVDRLVGGQGKDVLVGGNGRNVKDIFDFNKITESNKNLSGSDVIRDFQQGVDKIDLRTIDASTLLGGNNAFVFKAGEKDGANKHGTSKAGSVTFDKVDNAGTSNDYTVVYVDNDRDIGSEMAIKLVGLHDLTASDFIL